jgi:uncharacterized protein DUF4357
MSGSDGRTIRLFLVDGTPTGLITAEIMNWSGHALVAPRSRIGEVLKREEAGRTGIYFLVGDDPAQPTKVKVYVGEGDVVADRIRNHATDESKEFWTRFCLITSKDANLTKAHVRYLESRLVEITRDAARANLANGNEPGKKALPESDVADMEFFLQQIGLILPVVGFDFLRQRATAASAPARSTIADDSLSNPIELILTSKKYGYEATAIEVDTEITVLAGSRAMAGKEFAQNSYAPLREQLMKDGRLKPVAGKQLLVFAENVSFSSPSAAAAVINNHNSNGRVEWKLKSTGQTLKEWQDSQVV